MSGNFSVSIQAVYDNVAAFSFVDEPENISHFIPKSELANLQYQIMGNTDHFKTGTQLRRRKFASCGLQGLHLTSKSAQSLFDANTLLPQGSQLCSPCRCRLLGRILQEGRGCLST